MTISLRTQLTLVSSFHLRRVFYHASILDPKLLLLNVIFLGISVSIKQSGMGRSIDLTSLSISL